MRNIFFILFFPICLMSQPSNFRDYEVRRWHARFDWIAESGAVSYEIYKDNVLHGTSIGTMYTAQNLLENTNHIFKIRSVFGNGSRSSFSYEINVRTGLYPDERTAFSTETWTNTSFPVNRDGYTNLYGLYEQPVTNDTGYPRGNLTDYFSYPRASSFSSDNSVVGTDWPGRFWNTTDLSLNTTYTNMTTDRWFSTDPTTPTRFFNSGGSRTLTGYQDGSVFFTRTFTSFNSSSSMIPTHEDGPSWGEKIWALQDTQGTGNKVIVFNQETNTIIDEFDTGVDVEGGWVAISPYGNYLLVARQAASSDNYIDYYSIGASSTTFLRRDTFGFGHADLGVSMQGNEVVVYREGGNLRMRRMDNGAVTQLLGGDTPTTWFLIGHISTKNVLQPGWAFVNNNDGADYNALSSSSRKLAYRKLISVKLDENSLGYGTTIFRQYSNYAASCCTFQNHSTPNIDGRMVAFNKVEFNNQTVGYFVQQRTELGDEIPFDGSTPQPPTPTTGLKRNFFNKKKGFF